MNKYVQLSKKFNNRFWISETDYRFLKRLSVTRLSFHITASSNVCLFCALCLFHGICYALID